VTKFKNDDMFQEKQSFKENQNKKLKLDKSFKAPKDANALCANFDSVNGDFDTPEEFIRAYLLNDKRALNSLKMQDMAQLKSAIDKMYPEMKEYTADGVISDAEMKEILSNVKAIQSVKL